MGTVEQGAVSAVKTCMGTRSEDRVLIVTDLSQSEVGAALRWAAAGIAGE